ncbi:ATP-dependent Clp protease ATP-binding subunit [Isobaculum melis]|uniref:ATP-dependent Clp protease ATP-binding subunit ClpE n=1 Tax=Isobaculum melis TaxID=142588 RepID=A0A1H9T995_9LACT|nr:ATP-dependent Clp protease ATP-binding subunit [Isobaculum melis]SER93514.1 ATP-dependent Clp protease ATP-binding subunit ClpE [Isobaculum melis]
MNCQHCQQNNATIHLYTSVNGTKGQIDLCQNCYRQLKNVQDQISQGNQNPFGFNNIEEFFQALQQQGGENPAPATQNNGGNRGKTPRQQQKKGGILDEFGINLTQLAKDGLIDPVIGRDQEINRVIEILNRRTKNNPVLIGEPGVGKTAVIEGFAQKIVNGDVPQKLLNKEVISLDVASLVQGTGIRGQFEERMKKLMMELKENKNTILFIDEVHEIVGAGSAEGGMDAGNILKPALARGELQMVGATTLKEYRIIEKDAALERRVQPVTVNEPSVEESILILKGIQPKYEDYHHVHYTEAAIENAVKLSHRYIQDRFLPDKAIDLLDEAGSKMNLTIPALDPQAVEDKLAEVASQKQQALAKEDYEKAAYYRDQAVKLAEMRQLNDDSSNQPIITEKEMEQLIEQKTNIPVGQIKEKEQTQLKNLEPDLKAKIIGQNEAVEKVAKAIRRSRIGFNRKNRPIGSFLFVGPTGVGKTELAKQLANEMFGNQEALIRFDMSEYMEKHSVAKLIGSPPGYIGYDEAGQLTEKVRRNPYSIVLLDEVEKAHPDVMHLFLQILDDGRLTDAQGRTVSFKDTIIIMTSNAGTGAVEASVGFAATRSGNQRSVKAQLGEFFKPEFLNRFDAIVEFGALKHEALVQIVDLMLAEMNQLLVEQDLTLTVSEAVKEKMVELGYEPAMGARPLRRVIQEQIEDGIADYYLDHPTEKQLQAMLFDGEIVITSQDTVTPETTVVVEHEEQ